MTKHTIAGIRWWSPTQLLINRPEDYLYAWQSGWDARFRCRRFTCVVPNHIRPGLALPFAATPPGRLGIFLEASSLPFPAPKMDPSTAFSGFVRTYISGFRLMHELLI